MSTNLLPAFPHARPQRGAVLIIVLVMLIVMTLLALAGTRVSILQERMGGSLYDRSLAFQAAEAALREGEARMTLIRDNPASVGTNRDNTCTAGMCGFVNPNRPPAWTSEANWATAFTATNGFDPTMVATPRYLIEMLATNVQGEECPSAIDPDAPPCGGNLRMLRVTARVTDPARSDRASVMLQSIYTIQM